MFAIETSFKGNYIDFKRTDYGLLSKGAVNFNLYRCEPVTSANALRINTATIWQYYGNSSSAIMRRSGFNSEGVAYRHTNESIPIPDESISMSRAFTIYNSFERALVSVGLVAVIFSSELMPDVIDKKKIRELIKAPTITSSMLTSLNISLAEFMGEENKDQGVVYRTANGTATASPVCINPRIQRLSIHTRLPLPFDPNIDSDFLDGAIMTLSPVMLERLRVGFSMILRNPIFKVSVGLRVKKVSSMIRTPNDKPPIDHDAKRVEYNTDLFKVVVTGGVASVALILDGIPYIDRSTWPKIHITLSDQNIVQTMHANAIIAGIEAGRVSVDVPNQAYIPQITDAFTNSSDKVSLVLKDGANKIINLDFTDTTGSFSYAPARPTGFECYDQYIFPLTDIMGDYVIGSLSDIDELIPPAPTVLPSPFTIDTGTMDTLNHLV